METYMYITEQKKITETLNTIVEYINCMKMQSISESLEICINAVDAILRYIKNKKINFQVNYFEDLKKMMINNDNNLEQYRILVSKIINIIKKEKVRYKALFLPYKADMWTSMESIYLAAQKDENCSPILMPIPYYDIGNPNDIRLIYEKHRFPQKYKITDYQTYNLKAEEPDIIFIHNPYDGCNNLTRVPEMFFSKNLKQVTSCLVYCPYFTTASYTPGKSDFQYITPGIINADKIIVQSEAVKQIFLQYGYMEEKLVVKGSPKIDAVINAMKCENQIPVEWQEKVKGKKVFLLNTHLSYFPTSNINKNKYGDYAIRYHKEIMEEFIDNPDCALIWRPHPLMKNMLEDRFQECLSFVKDMERRIEESSNGVIDRNADYFPAFRCSDALISTYSSLINEYMVTGKPVLIFQKPLGKEANNRAPIKRNLNYFRIGENAISFKEFKQMVIENRDIMYDERMDMLRKAFLNLDGTAGEKSYWEIVNSIL